MKLDAYETEPLEAIGNASSFERVNDFKEAVLESKMAARNFFAKTKNVNIRIPEYDMFILKRRAKYSFVTNNTKEFERKWG